MQSMFLKKSITNITCLIWLYGITIDRILTDFMDPKYTIISLEYYLRYLFNQYEIEFKKENPTQNSIIIQTHGFNSSFKVAPPIAFKQNFTFEET